MTTGPETMRDDELADPGDVDLLEAESPETTWYVYRVRPSGTPLPAGVKPTSPGQFTMKFQGALDLADLARRIGPGIWRLLGKVNHKVRYSRVVEIAGVPWDDARFNASPQAVELERPAARPALTPEDVATIFRQELARLGGGFPPPMYQQQPPPPAPAPHHDPLQVLNVAMEMARTMTAAARPTENLEGMLQLVMGSWEKGRKDGARSAAGAGGGLEDSGLAEILKAVLPAILGAGGGQAPTAPTAPRAQAIPPPATPPPSAPRPFAPIIGPAHGAPPVAPVQYAPSPAAVAVPAAALPSTPQDFVVAALERVLSGSASPDRLAGAVDFYLEDDQLAGFLEIGAGGDYAPDFIAWAGGETSPFHQRARALASDVRVVRLIAEVQGELREMVEPDDGHDDDAIRAEAVEADGAQPLGRD